VSVGCAVAECRPFCCCRVVQNFVEFVESVAVAAGETASLAPRVDHHADQQRGVAAVALPVGTVDRPGGCFRHESTE
jgi:hypothetical protein